MDIIEGMESTLLQPRIHLGTVLRTGEAAKAAGELTELHYEQGGEDRVLQFVQPAAYRLEVQSLGGDELYLKGQFNPTMTAECARCLCDVNVPLQIQLGTMMRYQPSQKAPYLDEGESGEEVLVVGNTDLDLSHYLAETALLSMPLVVLHAPDCKGLCQKCGDDLNNPSPESSCDHMAPVKLNEWHDNDDEMIEETDNPFAVLKNLTLPS